MWQEFFKDCLSPFLCTGTRFPFSHSEGKVPFLRQDFKSNIALSRQIFESNI